MADWELFYETGFKPWDAGRPDPHLVRMVAGRPIAPCAALEIGCGTGTNAIWLARQGFAVTAIDIAAGALAQARAKDDAGRCRFVQADFLSMPAPEPDYGLVFDLGCFHYFHEETERVRFARRVAECLQEQGLWLSIMGSADGQQMGPPGRSALEVVQAVEPGFEIISIEASGLETADDAALQEMGLPTGVEHRAWCCLMRKRPTQTN